MDNNKGVMTMMSKSFLTAGIISLFAFYAGSTIAGSVTIPNNFVAGTKAVAADVNANFNAVKTAVDDNDTRVTTNTNNITTNTNNITTNTNNITTNTNNITTNATAIANLQGGIPGASCQGNDASDIMVRVGPLCVDKYEASVWNTAGGGGTQYGALADDYPCANNANDCTGASTIFARSEVGQTPSTNVTWFQAQQACAASGKRLLTNADWQMAVAGTPDDGTCAVAAAGLTGANAGCTSNWAVNDMIGNVQEWVADWVQGNFNNGGANPTWNPPAATNENANYGADGVFGINKATSQGDSSVLPSALLRGGSATANAGAFTLVANASPAFSAPNAGFRCAR